MSTTVATLEVTAATYDEIVGRLRALGQHHALQLGHVDLTGIVLERGLEAPEDERAEFEACVRRANDDFVVAERLLHRTYAGYTSQRVAGAWEGWQWRGRYTPPLPAGFELVQRPGAASRFALVLHPTYEHTHTRVHPTTGTVQLTLRRKAA